MNKFEIASKLEREKMTTLFKQNNVNSFYFTDENGYDREDGFYTATTRTSTKEIVFEVKNRDVASDRYSTTIIEKDKIDYLLQKGEESNHIPYVFFFFTDGYYTAIKLSPDVYYSSFLMDAPATTMGNNTRVVKEFVGFNILNLQKITSAEVREK